jgi:acetyl esterase
MPLDPNAEKLLLELAAGESPPAESVTVEESRAGIKELMGPDEHPEEVGRVEEREVPAEPFPVPVRIYHPKGDGPFPVIVFIHGGGWVICDFDTHDTLHRALCNEAQAIVVVIHHRWAPEHKFPAAIEDSSAALQWVVENAESFGGDPSRLVLGGDSAGGNVAAALAIAARNEGAPAIAFHFLIYPITDARMETQSYEDFAEGYFLTRDQMKWFRGHYVRSEADVLDPRVSPILEPDLSGLPPTLVVTAEYDPLRDEGEAYAQRLQEAGVQTTLHRYDGLIHGFVTLPHTFPQSREVILEVAAAMHAALAELVS